MRKEERVMNILRFQYIVNCQSPQWLVSGRTGDCVELLEAFMDQKRGLEPQFQEYKKEPEYILPDYCAILRIHAHDVELIPPADSMPRTICKYSDIKMGIKYAWLAKSTYLECQTVYYIQHLAL